MISIDYSLIIVVLNFVLILFVLNKLLYKPIKNFLAERQTRIAEDIKEAKEAKAEAEVLVHKREEELKGSSEEIRKLKQKAQRDADEQANDIIKMAKNQEKKILQDTEAQLKTEKVKAMRSLEGDLAAMVSALSSKVIGKEINTKIDDSVINQLITERGDK